MRGRRGRANRGELIAIMREDWRHNQRDWTRPGFRALAVYRFGSWQRSLSGRGLLAKVGRRLAGLVYRTAHRYVRNRYGIELHSSATVGRRVVLAHIGRIVIHRYGVIGDDCIIRHGVTIGAASRFHEERAPILGRGVNVGAGAVVIGEITIGDGVRIGPNAVVLTDVPADATVFAPPARIIRQSPVDIAADAREQRAASL